ncbi:hypothetical protein CAPTEDRAFT_228382 [Capitella teleta]|uniref:Thioredoxin-like fold domain-containing protein n=1 Tax=Capitella teleta TaxID=283909 RepID=R7UYY7_CAPTE|nr:hypothetical protein CAPTEDRAFT_228382 [Capitella teleta]|eukprot:ELU11539.1 hypothetical protein CAPTEDRAFT_228382 [Capitella teleta]
MDERKSEQKKKSTEDVKDVHVVMCICPWVAVATGSVASLDLIPSIAIPEQTPGIRISNGSSQVRLEVFLDLNCADSAHAWGVIKQLRDTFPGRLEVLLHSYPLPYHPYAFLCAQGLFAVQHMAPERVESYIDTVFDNMDQFTIRGRSRSHRGVISTLAWLTETSTGIPQSTFRSRISVYQGKAIGRWKYGARRGLSSKRADMDQTLCSELLLSIYTISREITDLCQSHDACLESNLLFKRGSRNFGSGKMTSK